MEPLDQQQGPKKPRRAIRKKPKLTLEQLEVRCCLLSVWLLGVLQLLLLLEQSCELTRYVCVTCTGAQRPARGV